MPTFDFACEDCGKIFEFSRPFGSSEMPACPKCHGTNIEKKISPPQIHFKGEGFYKTDSAKTSATPKQKDTDQTTPIAKPDQKSDAKKESDASAKG